MKKFLGIGFEFQAVDKNVNKFFDETNNQLKNVNTGLDQTNKKKPEKGSFWDVISNISQLGLLKTISSGIQDLSDKATDVQKKLVGRGVSEGFKNFEQLQRKLTLQIGDSVKATDVLKQSIKGVVDSAKVTEDTALQIVGTFAENNLELSKSGKLLERVGVLSKAFDLSAGDISQSFAFANKTLGLTEKGLMDVTNQATLLGSKTNFGKDLVGNLPQVFELVQKQIEKGIIGPKQAKDQIMRINNLTMGFRNTGIQIGKAQGFIENLTSSADKVSTAFSKIIAGESGDDIAAIAKDFGKLGLNVGEVAKAIRTGNIDDAFNQIRVAGAKAVGKGGDTLRAYKLLIEQAFGSEALGIIAAANTKAFEDSQKTINEVKASLADDTAMMKANKAFETLNNTIESQEEHLKGLQQRFDRGISESIEPSIKEYNKLKISILESMGEATQKETGNYFTNALVMMEKFKRGGLLPFIDYWSNLTGVSKDTFFKINAGFETIGSSVKDSLDDVFFFTGILANVAKLKPNPIKFMKTLGKSILEVGPKMLEFGNNAIEAGKSALDFGKALLKTSTFSKIYAGAMRLVGVATTIGLGPIAWAAAGVAALGAALYIAYQKSETFRDIVDRTWQSLKDFGMAIINLDFAYLWNSLKIATKFAYEWLTPFGLMYKGIMALGDAFPTVFGPIKKLISPIGAAFDKLASSIGSVLEKLGKFTSGAISKTFSRFTEWMNEDKKKSEGVAPQAATIVPEIKEVAKTIEAPKEIIKAASQQTQQGIEEATKQKTSAVTVLPATPVKAEPPKKMQEANTTPELKKFIPMEQLNKSKTDTAQQQDMKTLANVFIMVGNEIVKAITENAPAVNVELKGDVGRFMKATGSRVNNRLVNQGITG